MNTYTKSIAAGLASILVAFSANGEALAGSVSTIDFISDAANSTEQLGSYTGSINYDTSGLLDISLTNTSSPANGGFITRFMFNAPNRVVARLTSTTSSAPFHLQPRPRMRPFGSFDYGVTLRNRYNRLGIAQGTTESFQFAIYSPQAPTFSAIDFMSDFSYCTNKPALFMARFKGFDDGGSDKVPATVTAVPTPSAVLAGIVLLSGLALRRRRARDA